MRFYREVLILPGREAARGQSNKITEYGLGAAHREAVCRSLGCDGFARNSDKVSVSFLPALDEARFARNE